MPIWSYICEEILKRVCQSHADEKNRACSANETESSENRADALHCSLKIRTINKKNETYIRILRENLTFLRIQLINSVESANISVRYKFTK